MPKRIHEDHKHFRDVIKGRARQELSRLRKSADFVRQRPDGSRFRITVPGIEQPHIVFGDNGKGVGRGKGEKGKVVGRDPKPGEKGERAGEGHEGGMTVGVDLDEFLNFLQEELELPDMKPKPNQTFEEIKIRYNDISRIGPESLRHTRRTMMEAMKRLACSGDLNKLHMLPGMNVPVPLITPINQDKRYRQYQEEKIPSSNALIFFARDSSGSMDKFRTDIVSDMAWWIDIWIQKFYKRTERVYVIHDSLAEEVSRDKFYGYSGGGGTMCSSPFKMIADILENRFPADQYNIYIFYFSDGDNWGNDDNHKIVELLKGPLGPDIVNMVGFTEICPYGFGDSTLKQYMDKELKIVDHVSTLSGYEHVRTTYIGQNPDSDSKSATSSGGWGAEPLDEKERNQQIVRAIKDIIGKERVFK